MVDHPSKSMRITDCESEIDTEIADFDCDPDDIVKRHFPNVSIGDAEAIIDVVQC